MAVNESTGNLYAVQSDGTVGVFDADGAPLFEFGGGYGPEPGQFATTAGIAVNQATGHVYVLDMQFNYRIQEFEADGDFVRMWGVDVNGSDPSSGFEICTAASGDICQAGQSSTEPGGFSADGVSALMYLAIDPSTGNVIAPDAGNHRVQIFSSTGELVRVLGSATEHFSAGDTPASVAADSAGRVFALGSGSGGSVAAGPVFRFGADGAYLGSFDLDSRLHIAIDATTDHLYFTQQNEEGDWQIGEYDQDGERLEEHAIGIPQANGLALNSASGRIYVSDEAGGQILVIDEVPVLPQATMVAITDVAGESATFEATVDPQGTAYDTHWRFVCTPACPGLSGGNAGNGTGAVAVSEEASGLDPNTEYEVRLVATRELGAGQAASVPVAFSTEEVQPTSSMQEEARVTDTSARLGALIDARNSQTAYYFEYGTDESYGGFAPAGKAGDAGDGLGEHPRFQTVTGLKPETTYHFRLVARSDGGTLVGENLTFTTRSTAEAAIPPRGIELVNTPDKSNQSAYGYLAEDGHSVVWKVYTGGPEAPIGLGASLLAQRTETGWRSRNLVPPPSEQYGDGELGYYVYGATDDFSQTVFQVGEPPRDGGVSPELYLVRIGPNREQELLHTVPPNTDMWTASSVTAADTRHFYMLTSERLHPSHPEGTLQVYDVAAKPPTLISRMPETGEAVPCGLQADESGTDFGMVRRWAALDGSRVFFETTGSDCGGPAQLYAYETHGTEGVGDDTTVRISPPSIAGPQGHARLIQAAEDGTAAIFIAAGRLVATDENDNYDIYKWTVGEPLSCLTCVVPDADVRTHPNGPDSFDREVHVSEDLSRVYFTSLKVLFPGEGNPGDTNLYVWHDGEIKYISPSDGFGQQVSDAESTPDGSVIVFQTNEPGVTIDDNGGNYQLYRYDDRAGTVECLTCPPPGETPVEPDLTASGLPGVGGSRPSESENYRLTADGDTFFFLTEAKLVERDVNNDTDIYQWHNGKRVLVTDGVTEYTRSVGRQGRLELLGIGRDGVNVLFRTAVAQTGYERDKLPNLYVARVGGGFPDPEPPAEACLEDACQGPLTPALPFSRAASESLRGAGNVREGAVRRRCVKRKVMRGKRCVTKRARKRSRKGVRRARKGSKNGTRRNGAKRRAAAKQGRSK